MVEGYLQSKFEVCRVNFKNTLGEFHVVVDILTSGLAPLSEKSWIRHCRKLHKSDTSLRFTIRHCKEYHRNFQRIILKVKARVFLARG